MADGTASSNALLGRRTDTVPVVSGSVGGMVCSTVDPVTTASSGHAGVVPAAPTTQTTSSGSSGSSTVSDVPPTATGQSIPGTSIRTSAVSGSAP